MPDFGTNSLHRHLNQIIWFVSLCVVALLLTNCTTSSQAAYSYDTYEGTQLDGLASEFQLTDQFNKIITLRDLRGSTIALTFLDSLCVDVCPLTSAQLLKTTEALGTTADSVIFLGVNVNEKANKPEDVMHASRKWHLDKIKTWHFLTGDFSQLEPVWKAYNIEVETSLGSGSELLHTMGVYLIDKNGHLRWFISTPFVEAGTPAPSLPLNELLVKHIEELLSSG